MTLHVRHRGTALAFVVLFALGQALMWYAYYGHGAKVLIGDEQGYQDTALAILAGGPWMPSSIWPPLQPLLLAALYWLAGSHVLVAQIAQTLLLLACALLLRGLWRELGGSVAAANWAAALLLLSPPIAAYAQWLWPEIPHLFLLLAALRLLALARRQWLAPAAHGRAAGTAALAGVCVGLALLAKSLLSGFWPLFLLMFVRRTRPRGGWRAAAAFVLGLGLVTAPALVHGWRSHGKPMIADSSVYNLWMGLTDRWRSDYVQDMGGIELPAFLASGSTPQQRNAVYLGKVREWVAGHGLGNVLAAQLGRQYFRLFNAKTLLVSQLPGPACAGHLSTYHTAPWLTRTLTWLNHASHALILVAAAFGLACWRRRMGMLHLVVVLLAAYQLVLFAFIHVKARFLLPLMPFLCGLAGEVLARLAASRRAVGMCTAAAGEASGRSHTHAAPPALAASPDHPPGPGAARLLAGAALAALLLVLAFAPAALDRLCAG